MQICVVIGGKSCFLFLRKTFSNMCYTLCKQCSIDKPKERYGEALDCQVRLNTSLGWEA